MHWFVKHGCKSVIMDTPSIIVTLRPSQNGRRYPDDIFKRIFLNENICISINISLTFVPKGPINNIPALVQIMAWRRPGDKPLFEPMLVNLVTHICVTRPQWVIQPHTNRELSMSNETHPGTFVHHQIITKSSRPLEVAASPEKRGAFEWITPVRDMLEVSIDGICEHWGRPLSFLHNTRELLHKQFPWSSLKSRFLLWLWFSE